MVTMARDEIKTQMGACKIIRAILAGILIILVSQQSFANQEKRRFFIKYPGHITSFMNYFNWLESELMSKSIKIGEHAERLERMEDTIYKRIIIHNALCGENNLDY